MFFSCGTVLVNYNFRYTTFVWMNFLSLRDPRMSGSQFPPCPPSDRTACNSTEFRRSFLCIHKFIVWNSVIHLWRYQLRFSYQLWCVIVLSVLIYKWLFRVFSYMSMNSFASYTFVVLWMACLLFICIGNILELGFIIYFFFNIFSIVRCVFSIAFIMQQSCHSL